MKKLEEWSLEKNGWLRKDVYLIEHGSSIWESKNWSRIHFIGRSVNEILCPDALLKNVVEVERRISTEEDFIINGYHLYEVEEDAIYVAKSLDDVLNYCKNTYGAINDVYDCDETEFHKLVTQINLCENIVHTDINFLSDDDGTLSNSTYYKFYSGVAEKDDGCKPIIFFNV
ncbi:hypothetical protein [Acinetobacter haemolyticus]|uniref:hypothetical protein n=1 Tax=Acinetobacter haemolyticus TaxID=29430 RepID=UPI00325C2C18